MFTIRDVIAFGSNDDFNGKNSISSSLLLFVFSPSLYRLVETKVRRLSVNRRLSVDRSANGISVTGFSVTGFGWKSVLRA